MLSMKLIVGLGNPGKAYEHTRHNMGFDVLDILASSWGFDIETKGFEGKYERVKYVGTDLVLLKPETFMNLSGRPIRQCKDFYKIDLEDIIVVYDDMDIEIGHLKLKENGSSGGHNGIKSIISELGTEQFKRIRVGVGHPTQYQSVVDYVLNKPTKEEEEKLAISKKNAAEAIKISIKESFNKAMTIYNK